MRERWTLAVAAVCFGIGAVTIWTAALMPQFFPIWSGSGNQLEIVGRHTTLWRMNAILFTISAVTVLIGCALVGLGITTLTSAVLGMWVGWVMIASAVLSLGCLVLLRDLPAVVAYLPVLPLAIATGVAAAQT